MAPNLIGGSSLFLDEATRAAQSSKSGSSSEYTSFHTQASPNQPPKYKWNIVWRNVIFFIYLHITALQAFYNIFAKQTFAVFLWNFGLAMLAAQGVTAGAHRLWAHKSYKANLPLRIILAFCFTIAFQDDIHQWVRDHRAHHKFNDTDADPYNAKRGFFFSHMGWLITRKHPAVREKAKTLDMSDILADPVVRFHRKYYAVLMPIAAFIAPTLIPYYWWNENLLISWNMCLMRYCISLHCTWLVNSAAHIYGMRPFDKNISSVENRTVALLTLGEGWHNYHHVFPWDYKAAELGFNGRNLTAGVIDLFAKWGWATELKTVSQEMIEKRSARTGDGSRHGDNENPGEQDHREGDIWGWGDKDMPAEEVEEVKVFNNLKSV